MLFSFCLLLVGCRSEKGVTIFNPNPEAQITSHQEGDQVQEGTEVLFVGNVSDPNHGPEELRASWVYGGEELCSNQVPDIDGTTTCAIVMAESTDIVLEVQDHPKSMPGASRSPNGAPRSHQESSRCFKIFPRRTQIKNINALKVVWEASDRSQPGTCSPRVERRSN